MTGEIPGQTGQTLELISHGLTGLTWNFPGHQTWIFACVTVRAYSP